MNLSGLMGGVYYISQWIMRLSITNILWLLFNLPIVYFMINLMFLENKQSIVANMIVITIMLPIIFFPATTALFGVVRRWVLKDFDAPLFKSFLTYYKLNYLRSFLGGMVIVPIWVALIVNFLYYSENHRTVAFSILIIVTMFLFVITSHFLANTVHLEIKFFDSLRSSVYLCCGNVFYSLAIFLTTVLIFYVSFYVFTFFMAVLIGPCFAAAAFFGYLRAYTRVQSLQNFVN
jgi:uncharacterized membrane protein YesL